MNIAHFFQRQITIIMQKLYFHKKIFFFYIGSVFFWGILTHAYGFLHSSFSHDVLNAFIATPVEELWKIELGRFCVPIYRMVFRGPVTLPWLIGMLGLVWTSIAVFLIIKIFNIKSRFLGFLIAGLMTTNITYTAQIATYIYEFDVNAFALMLSVLTVYMWLQNKKILTYVVGAICLMTSLGLYQAYFAVAVTVIVIKCIMNLFDNVPAKNVFFHGVNGIGMILVGGCLYLFTRNLVCDLTGINLQNRVNILPLEENGILLYLNLVLPALKYLISNILHVAYRNTFFIIIVLFVSCLLVASVIYTLKKKEYHNTSILLIVVLLAIIPFAMTSIYFGVKGQNAHDLTTYAVWFFYIFIGILVYWICAENILPELINYILKALTCILIGTVLYQNIIIANTAYIKKELEATAILSTMTNVVSMIENYEEYVPEKTTIAFIGTPQNIPFPQGMERVSTIVGLQDSSVISYDVSTYYYNAYKAYFSYVLQYPIQFCDDDVHDDLKKDKRVKILPSYPQKGCIEMIDEVLVIKMSN